MPRSTFFLACWAALVWPGGSGRAQEDELYRVEVIVFSQPPARVAYYRWPGEPDISEAVDLNPWSAAEDLTDDGLVFGDGASGLYRREPDEHPSPLIPAQPDFELIDPQALVLAEDWRRLDESRDFEPLLHLAWRQPAAGFGEPQPVRVHGGGLIDRGPTDTSRLLLGPQAAALIEAVDGTVAFERGRYLHLRIDLALHLPAGEGHSHPADPDTLDNARRYFTFRLQERRQVQIDMVNYFDHQRFGVIALVQKWQPPDPDPPAF